MNSTTTLSRRTPADARELAGEIECLNCGRALAMAYRTGAGAAFRIRPLRPGAPIEVAVRQGSRLQCTRCGGRAFVEFGGAEAA